MTCFVLGLLAGAAIIPAGLGACWVAAKVWP